jgi:hypothetical protein
MIINEVGNLLASMKEECLQKMYYFPVLDVFLNKPFMDAFIEDNPMPINIIQEWWDEYGSFFFKISRVYNIQYCKVPYQLRVAIVYKLFGEGMRVHFKLEWVPIEKIVA